MIFQHNIHIYILRCSNVNLPNGRKNVLMRVIDKMCLKPNLYNNMFSWRIYYDGLIAINLINISNFIFLPVNIGRTKRWQEEKCSAQRTQRKKPFACVWDKINDIIIYLFNVYPLNFSIGNIFFFCHYL